MSPQMFLDLVGSHAAERFRKGVLPFVDLYAGAGGTSTGTIAAFEELGLKFQLAAVNHWRVAVNTHAKNHAGHIHFCCGVDRVDVKELLRDADSDGIFGLWGSPSCTTHSQARGGVPINDQSRSGCYALIYWLRRNRAIHMWVENVKAFLNYGPLMQKLDKAGVPLFLRKDDKGKWCETRAPRGCQLRPKEVPAKRWWKEMEARFGIKPAMVADPKYRGVYFHRWVREVRRLGYDVEWRVLNAADWGAATDRERLIVQAVLRASGRKIVWPNPTHAVPNADGTVSDDLLPWNTVRRRVVNWRDVGESVFDRARPLAPKSIDRIAVGIFRYGFNDANVVKFKGTGTANSVDKPLGTVQASGQHYGLATPRVDFILPQQRGTPTQLRVKSVDGPMPTIAGRGADALATAEFLIPNFGERPTQVPRTHSVDAPAPAVTSHGAGGVVRVALDPCLVVVNHGNGKEGDKANLRRVRSVDAPCDTVTGSNSLYLSQAIALGGGEGGEAPWVVETWQDLSAAIKAGIARARSERGYRPLISYKGRVFRLEVFFRMLRWRELARAQSFPEEYEFEGTDTDKVKMIGNAVPPALARAVVKAAISQTPDVGVWDVCEQLGGVAA